MTTSAVVVFCLCVKYCALQHADPICAFLQASSAKLVVPLDRLPGPMDGWLWTIISCGEMLSTIGNEVNFDSSTTVQSVRTDVFGV